MQSVVILAKELLVVIMAVYEYKCCGITVEIVASIKDDVVAPICSVCNSNAKRVYNTFGISFKGKGFYATDKTA